jgi:hypothetical protein
MRPEDLDPIDREALEDSIHEMTRQPLGAKQLEKIRRLGRSWYDIALFACYSCQFDNMRRLVFDPTPMDVKDRDHPEPDEMHAALVLRKMLREGISRYHPDPYEALEIAADRRTA